ncbi:hypothetical protein NZK33_18650 [Cyanobium sp. FGCU-6]|nr:hypothetical protein [Cyanobium sp. FGCU6]
METVFKFLTENSGALSVLFSAAVTVATVVYAILTWKLVTETRLLREAQTEPRIEIMAQPFETAFNLLRLQVRNTGLGPAHRLRFRIKVIDGGEPAERMLDELTKPNFFAKGLEYFGPGQERFSAFTDMTVDFNVKVAAIFEVRIRYESATRKRYEEMVVIDMAEWKGAQQLGTPSLYKIANSIDKIQRDIGHFATGFRRLRIDAYTQVDRDRESNEIFKRYEDELRESGQGHERPLKLQETTEQPDAEDGAP